MTARTSLGLYGGPAMARAAATAARVPSRRTLTTEARARVLTTEAKTRVLTTT